MSVEVISWALNLAPVPLDKNGKPNTACAIVLLGLANHASPDGTAAHPSARTLARYSRLSVRHVRTALDRLEAADIIRPGDPAVLAAHIRRADRRTQIWDLNIRLIRDDLTDDDIAELERLFPGLSQRVAAQRGDKQSISNEVKSVHSARNAPESPMDNPDNGVKPVHPAKPDEVKPVPHGVNSLLHGVKPVPSRGEPSSPEPSYEPSMNRPEPPPPPEREEQQSQENQAAGGDLRLGEFFDGLGPAWPLSPTQRERLAPAARRALSRGWEPEALAAHVGANTDGVRNPYAVLSARLRPTELPEPSRPGGQPGAGPATRAATGDRRQRELDELEARMFGEVRGMPVRNPDIPNGSLLLLTPEWIASADDTSPRGPGRAPGRCSPARITAHGGPAL